MYLCGLQRLGQAQRRHYGGQPFRQHRLAGARRTHQQYVVATGACDLKRPLDALLPLDFREIEVEHDLCAGKFGAGVKFHRRQLRGAPQQIGHVKQAVHPIDFKIVYHGGLRGICLRNDYALIPALAGLDCHGKCAAYRQHGAVEGQLAHNHVPAQFGRLNLPRAYQQGDSDGKVVGRTLFLDIGRSHVHHHALARKVITALANGRNHTLVAFLDSGVRETDNAELQAVLNRYFNGDDQGVNAVDGGSVSFDKHFVED